MCVAAGAPGITVHPRADNRHITLADVRDVAAELAPLTGRVEYNIEGDPREDLVTLVCEVRADQATLVPVHAGGAHQPGRLAAGYAARAPPPGDRPAARGRGACQPVRGPGAARDRLGGVAAAPTASSSIPSRTRARSNRGAPRARLPWPGTPARQRTPTTRSGCERRPRSRPGKPAAVHHGAACPGGLDWPRADQPCPVHGARSRSP